jgi:hypothetical protein
MALDWVIREHVFQVPLSWFRRVFPIRTYSRILTVQLASPLSTSELASLREVGKGFAHGKIPKNDEKRLLELRLVYMLLGNSRITAAGRRRLLLGN